MSERPLRICHITTFYPPYSFGGDAIFVHALANELAARGHHNEVIYCEDSYLLLNGAEPTRHYTNHPDVVLHGLRSRWGTLSPLATQQTGYPLLKQQEINRVLARGFDVIHYHNASLIAGPKGLELGNAVKLYTTHDYWIVCPMNVLFRYDGVACEKQECLRCTLAYHRPPQWWRYTKMMPHALKHVDAFIHPSRFSQAKHRALGLQGRSEVIPYFFKPNRVDIEEPGTSLPTQPYFLYVGRLEPLKGVQTLLPVFRQYPHARLVIAGDGMQRAELQMLAADSPNIEFVGWKMGAELEALYNHAIALLVPSLCFENGPIVALEAMAHHLPIIGRDLGSISQLIHADAPGILFSDELSLRQALDELLDHPETRRSMGQNGYRVFEREHTVSFHMEHYLGLIAELQARREHASELG